MTKLGTGSLWLDGKQLLAKVRYEITEQGPRPGSVLNRIDGRLVIDEATGGTLMMNHFGPNSDLQLHLEDGRRWLCNLISSDGTLNNRGGLHAEA